MAIKKSTCIGFILSTIFCWNAALAQDVDRVEQTAEIIKDLCWSGRKDSTHAEIEGGLSLFKRGGEGELEFSQSEMPALMEALSGKVSALNARLSAEETQKIRDCVKPYMDSIIRASLGLSDNERLAKPLTSQTVPEVDGIRFKVEGCSVATNDTVSCEVTIENMRDTREIWLRNSKSGIIYDNVGHQSEITNVVFGNAEAELTRYGYGLKRNFVRNVPVKSKLTFRSVSPNATAISEMRLRFQYPGINVVLKDISLSR